MVADDSVYITIGGYVVSTLISVVILKYINYNERRSIKRTEDIKTTAKMTAENVAKNTDNIARTQSIHTEKIANELKEVTATIASELQAKVEVQTKTILSNINSLEVRLTNMIDVIHRKTELTNGNVANIRNDMLELQEDIDTIYAKLNRKETSPEGITERSRRHRRRRTEISDDAKVQNEHNTSSYYASPIKDDMPK